MPTLSRRAFVSGTASALLAGASSTSAAHSLRSDWRSGPLRDRALAGLREWFAAGGGALSGLPFAAYEARLDVELEVITRLGMERLFVAAERCAAEARAPQFIVAPGSGATCNSLLALALGITRIDPLRHDLAFERFASLERRGKDHLAIGVEPRAFLTLVAAVEPTFGEPAIDFDWRGYGPAAASSLGRG